MGVMDGAGWVEVERGHQMRCLIVLLAVIIRDAVSHLKLFIQCQVVLAGWLGK